MDSWKKDIECQNPKKNKNPKRTTTNLHILGGDNFQRNDALRVASVVAYEEVEDDSDWVGAGVTTEAMILGENADDYISGENAVAIHTSVDDSNIAPDSGEVPEQRRSYKSYSVCFPCCCASAP